MFGFNGLEISRDGQLVVNATSGISTFSNTNLECEVGVLSTHHDTVSWIHRIENIIEKMMHLLKIPTEPDGRACAESKLG